MFVTFLATLRHFVTKAHFYNLIFMFRIFLNVHISKLHKTFQEFISPHDRSAKFNT